MTVESIERDFRDKVSAQIRLAAEGVDRERDLHTEARQRVISNALSLFQVEDRDGELVLDVPGSCYGDALYSFVQALLRISDASCLLRERVRSTANASGASRTRRSPG